MRVIADFDEGMWCNVPTRRFSIAVSTAVQWVRAWRTTGVATPSPKSGDLRSYRIEAFRELLLSDAEIQRDIALVELAAMLEQDHGAIFARSTIWRFLDWHGMTFKKQRTPATRNDPTLPRGETGGSRPSLISIPHFWSSSMRPALPRRRWHACADGRSAASDAGRWCRTGIGRRRPSPVPCGFPA